MKRVGTFAGAALLALTLAAALPVQADPPHHDHGTYSGGYAGDRYQGRYYGSGSYGSGYGSYGGYGGVYGSSHPAHDAYDHGYGSSRGDYGYSGGGYDYGRDGYGYSGGNAYRHDGHAAEPWKWTHGGRHVIDARHGHHR